jgi:hypothetical protein
VPQFKHEVDCQNDVGDGKHRIGPESDHERLWAETLALLTTYLGRFGSPRAWIWVWGPCFLLQMAGPSL